MRTLVYRSFVSRILTIALVAFGLVSLDVGTTPAHAAGTTPQTITVTSTIPSAMNVGQLLAVSATSSSGLPVDISAEGIPGGVCSLTPREVRADFVGTCLINFDQAGDSTYAAADTVTVRVSILGSTNVITTTAEPLIVQVGGTSQISASVTSGIPLQYAVVTYQGQSPNCSVNSTGLVTGLSIGPCNVALSSSAIGAYPAPRAVLKTVVVTGQQQAPLTLVVPPTLNPGTSGTISVAGGSGTGTTTITATGDCTVSGNTVTANSAGTSCTILATNSGDSTYAPIATSQTFSIASISGSGGSAGGSSPDPSPTPLPTSSADSGDIVFALDQDATKTVKPSLDAFDIQATTGGVMIFKGRNLLSVLSVTVGNGIPVKILKSSDAQIDLELPTAEIAGWQTVTLRTAVGEKLFEKTVNYLAAPRALKPVVKILKGFKADQKTLSKSQKVALTKFVKAVGAFKMVNCRGLAKPIYMTCKYLKTIYKAGKVRVTKLKLKPASAGAKQVRLIFSR